jgi:hypothetical protein
VRTNVGGAILVRVVRAAGLGYIVGREGEGGLVGWWVEWVAASPPLGRVCGTAGRMYGSIPRLPLFLNYQFFFRED